MIIVELCVNAYLEFGLVLSTVSGQDLLIFTEHRNTLEGTMSTQINCPFYTQLCTCTI